MNKDHTNKPIPLLKPLLPELEEFKNLLDSIWESGRLTNNARYNQLFERQLSEYCGIENISLCTNATLGLMIALKSLNLKGEIITTPFTWIATSMAIHWNNLKPVFVDIDKYDFNLNIDEVKKAINPSTCAILPVHVFGNPCKPFELEDLAKRNNIKLIYDSAHCFGVKYLNKPLCSFGDLSVLSFHATKTFNSLEGGAIISNNRKMKTYIDSLINYGFDSEQQLKGYGLNAHFNELQAAYGLLQLKHVDKAISERKMKYELYTQLLSNVEGISIPEPIRDHRSNYSFFPVLIDQEQFGFTRDEVRRYLSKHNITTRTYFSPLVTGYKEFSMYRKHELTIAKMVSDRILCLPLYHNLQDSEVVLIVDLIKSLKKDHFESIANLS